MEWQWQGDQGQWELYSEDAQQALSEAYCSIPGRQLLQRRPGPGQPSVVQLVFTLPASPQHAQPKQQMYEMDFFSRPMVQRNVGSGKQRSIRLVAAVPPVDRLSLPTRIQEPQPEGAPAADEQDSSADDVGASAASSANRARLIEIYTEHKPRKVQDVDQLLREWVGREEQLVARVERKYCPSDDGAAAAGASVMAAAEPQPEPGALGHSQAKRAFRYDPETLQRHNKVRRQAVAPPIRRARVSGVDW
jgi:hypothetical protein